MEQESSVEQFTKPIEEVQVKVVGPGVGALIAAFNTFNKGIKHTISIDDNDVLDRDAATLVLMEIRNYTVINKFAMPMTRQKLLCLKHETWINDEVGC